MEVFPLSYGMAKSLSHLLLWWLYLFAVFSTFCYRSKTERAAALWHTGTHVWSTHNLLLGLSTMFGGWGAPNLVLSL